MPGSRDNPLRQASAPLLPRLAASSRLKRTFALFEVAARRSDVASVAVTANRRYGKTGTALAYSCVVLAGALALQRRARAATDAAQWPGSGQGLGLGPGFRFGFGLALAHLLAAPRHQPHFLSAATREPCARALDGAVAAPSAARGQPSTPSAAVVAWPAAAHA